MSFHDAFSGAVAEPLLHAFQGEAGGVAVLAKDGDKELAKGVSAIVGNLRQEEPDAASGIGGVPLRFSSSLRSVRLRAADLGELKVRPGLKLRLADGLWLVRRVEHETAYETTVEVEQKKQTSGPDRRG